MLPVAAVIAVPKEQELALATRLTAATKWMATNGKARCDAVSPSLAYGLAVQRQRKLEKEVK